VPLVRGKSLSAAAWRVFFPVLLQEEGGITGLNWWNFLLQPISADDLARHDISTWNVPLLTNAATLLASVAELLAITGHIRDFKTLPELDDIGLQQLQQYVQSIEAHIRDAFQKVIDAWNITHTRLKRQVITENELDSELVKLTQLLEKIKSSLLPASFKGDAAFMTHVQFIEWADQLENVSEHIWLFYLRLATIVLEKRNF
jgi:hypothetical protein